MSRRAPPPATRAPAATSPGRWALRALVASAIVASLVVGGAWVLHTSYFRVEHVRVTGADGTRVTSAQVSALSDLGSHPAMIDVNTGEITRRIEALAWVKRAVVLEHWPSTITIAVTERTPVAVAYGARRQLVLVDASGAAIAPAPTPADFPLLIATGQRAGEPWPFGTWASAAPFVAAQLPVAFSAQVAAVRVNRAGDVTLAMTSPISFTLGPARDLHNKFVAVAAVIAHARLNPGDVIDVSVPSTVAVTGP